MALKALIFDCDGTIADTEEAHRTAFNRAFADAGLDWHWSVARYRELLNTTGGKERIARFMADDHKPPTDIGAVHAAKNRIYAASIADMSLRPGIRALMHTAAENEIALSVATTTSRVNLDALIAATPLREVKFAALVCGEDVTRKKPDPEVYRVALDRLGLRASECLAFEDSANGLQSARVAGIATVVTPNEYTRGSSFCGAALVTNDLVGDLALDRAGVVARLHSLLAARSGQPPTSS